MSWPPHTVMSPWCNTQAFRQRQPWPSPSHPVIPFCHCLQHLLPTFFIFYLFVLSLASLNLMATCTSSGMREGHGGYEGSDKCLGRSNKTGKAKGKCGWAPQGGFWHHARWCQSDGRLLIFVWNASIFLQKSNNGIQYTLSLACQLKDFYLAQPLNLGHFLYNVIILHSEWIKIGVQ